MTEEAQHIEGLPDKQLSLFGAEEAVELPKRGRPKLKKREKPPLRVQKVATKLPPIRLLAEIHEEDGYVTVLAGRQNEGPTFWERGSLKDLEALLTDAVTHIREGGDGDDDAETVLAEVDIQELEITE